MLGDEQTNWDGWSTYPFPKFCPELDFLATPLRISYGHIKNKFQEKLVASSAVRACVGSVYRVEGINGVGIKGDICSTFNNKDIYF